MTVPSSPSSPALGRRDALLAAAAGAAALALAACGGDDETDTGERLELGVGLLAGVGLLVPATGGERQRGGAGGRGQQRVAPAERRRGWATRNGH